MGQGTRVQNDSVRRFARLLDPVDELAFMVALPEIDLEAKCPGAGGTALLDVAERVMPVYRRIAHPEQVQIGAVQDKNDRQARPPDTGAAYTMRRGSGRAGSDDDRACRHCSS